MNNSLDVAKLFLSWANSEGDVITNLKMQKLLYYADAWHLVNFKKQLFAENILAWPLGPVVREVYDAFKRFGSAPIAYKNTNREAEKFTKSQVIFLKEFYGIYIRLTAHELVDMTHNDEPWKQAFAGQEATISRALMQSFYDKQYRETLRKKKVAATA
jgi:uncharacterized phage-associated protein